MIDRLYNIILVGSREIGKTQLLSQYTTREFEENYNPTIGVDFKTKHLEIQGLDIKLNIWDTAGQLRFRTITNSYYRGSHGILICYDVSNRESFNNLIGWIEDVQSYSNPEVILFIVGLKCLSEEREVSYEEGLEFAQRNQLDYIECDSKLGLNIEKVFYELVSRIFYFNQKERFEQININTNSRINIKPSLENIMGILSIGISFFF